MKAKRSFVYGALGSFQGDLSPLSTSLAINTCVAPVLLYGPMDCLLGELAKRALMWPKNHSNTVALGLESVQARVLVRKLSFLVRRAGAAVIMDEVDSICLVRERRGREEVWFRVHR